MSDRDEQLERFIGRVLRDQPPLQAPAGLEANVLREIERRAALPWWRKSFMHWPQLARIAFIVASFGVVKLALDAFVWLTVSLRASNVATAIEQPVGWVHTISSIGRSLGTAAEALVSAIPPLWLYSGLLLGLAMYVALFGVGAAVYRTLTK
jgi:hypothetical protein